MARFGGAVMRGVSSGGSWLPRLRRAYGNYEEFDVFAGAETAEKICINGYDENKFYANGVEVEGAIICLSRLTLKWIPKSFGEITPGSLAIFELLRPAPEILILGCGKRMGQVSNELRGYLRSNGIKLEAIDTANAISTFNFLNEEGRIVAAAMLPQDAPAELQLERRFFNHLKQQNEGRFALVNKVMNLCSQLRRTFSLWFWDPGDRNDEAFCRVAAHASDRP